MTRAFVLLDGGRPEERGRCRQEGLVAGVGGKAASSFGVGSGPSPEMLPHPWQQPPPWVSATRLGTPSPPLLWLQRNRGVEVKGGSGGQ